MDLVDGHHTGAHADPGMVDLRGESVAPTSEPSGSAVFNFKWHRLGSDLARIGPPARLIVIACADGVACQRSRILTPSHAMPSISRYER